MFLNSSKVQAAKGFVLLIGISCVISGCGSLHTRSTLRNNSDSQSFQYNTVPAQAEKVVSIPIEISASDTASDLKTDVKTEEASDEGNKASHTEQYIRTKIPVELNASVNKWIDYFSKKDHERFQRFLNRGHKYREVVESVLEENDLPAELYYLAMIESGYQTKARSHASAVGVWQFIAGTGHRYGLRIDRYVDERRDPIRSTEAAAKYLRDLYNVFGSWHLAMAAYNAGEIRILRAIMKARTRNFWELTALRALPSETANYVPKFLAVVLIGQNPEKYGFNVDDKDSIYPDLEAIEVPGSIPLAVIAKTSGVPLSTLQMVNPHLLRGSTPLNSSSYEIWTPVGTSQKIASISSELSRIAKQNRAITKVAKKNNSRTYHVVKRGENLTVIARKYKISTGHLKRINNLKSSRLFAGTKLRIQMRTYKASTLVRYRVRRGDNLTIIARRFKTTPNKIKAANKMNRNRIFVGQTLKIVKNN